MVDEFEFASGLFGSRRVEERAEKVGTATIFAKALGDSKNGMVAVEMYGETTLGEDGGPIMIPTSPSVAEGDTVLISMSGGIAKTPMVVASGGEGDRQDAAIASAARAAQTAWEYADSAHEAAANAQESADEAAEAANAAQASANQAQSDAATAKGAAEQAVDDAATASGAAQRAQADATAAKTAATQVQSDATAAKSAAQSAQADATAAKTSAAQANTAANTALAQLSVIEDVAGTLDWISEHGTFKATTDTTVQEGTVYFELSGGDYVPIAEPSGNPKAQGWYVLNVSDSQADFIMAHLAVTSAGLWVLPSGIGKAPDEQHASGYKALLSSDGLTVYDGSGKAVATYGEGISFDSERPVRVGGDVAYIEYYDSDGDGKAESLRIVGAAIELASGKTVEEELSDAIGSIEVGGRNLLRGTAGFAASDWARSDSASVTCPEPGVLRLGYHSSARYAKYKADYLDFDGYGEGAYTLSFEARCDDDGSGGTAMAVVPYIGFSLGSRTASIFSSSYDRYLSGGSKAVTGEWARYSLTASSPDGIPSGQASALAAGSHLTVQFGRTASAKPVLIRNVKLERGNKATDWTPAPEDTDAAIAAVESVVSDHATAIRQNSDSIALKADATDVYTKAQTDGLISTEVSNRNAAITAKANEITSEVSSTYTTKAESSQLATRISQTESAIGLTAEGKTTIANPNLSPFFSVPLTDVQNATTNPDGYWNIISAGANITELSDGWAHIRHSISSGTATMRFHPYACDWVKPGQTYTLLVEFRDMEVTGTARIYAGAPTTAAYTPQMFQGQQYKSFTSSTEELRFVYAAKADLSGCLALIATSYYLTGASSLEGDVRVSLYEGDYRGPYKPYSGDILFATKSEFEVAVDGITSTVSSKVGNDEVISKINQSAESVKIQAKHVEIDGEVTFNAIKASADAAYDAKGAAGAVQANLDAEAAARRAVFGTCSTAAGTAAKAVACADFALNPGAAVAVKFTTANTAAAPTLDVNGTGAVPIWYNNAVAASGNPVLWGANATLTFVYDATVAGSEHWTLVATPPSYSAACSTAATTRAKAATVTGALVVNGTELTLNFSTANTYVANSVQVNLSGTGATNVYKNRAATSATNTLLWAANTTLTFVRQGAGWYLADGGLRKNVTHISDDGIRVHAANNPASNYAQVSADGLEVFKGGSSVALFGSAARVGAESGPHVGIDSGSVQILDGDVPYLTLNKKDVELNSVYNGAVSHQLLKIANDRLYVTGSPEINPWYSRITSNGEYGVLSQLNNSGSITIECAMYWSNASTATVTLSLTKSASTKLSENPKFKLPAGFAAPMYPMKFAAHFNLVDWTWSYYKSGWVNIEGSYAAGEAPVGTPDADRGTIEVCPPSWDWITCFATCTWAICYGCDPVA